MQMIILCKCYKIYEDYIEVDTAKVENTEIAERQITSVLKEQVKTAELCKHV